MTLTPLDQWEAEATEFYRDTGYMRPGKDDIRGFHTDEARRVAFQVWGVMRVTYSRLRLDPALTIAHEMQTHHGLDGADTPCGQAVARIIAALKGEA